MTKNIILLFIMMFVLFLLGILVSFVWIGIILR